MRALDRMIIEGFRDEVKSQLNAEEVSSVNVWEESIPGRGNCKRKFLFLIKKQAQGTENRPRWLSRRGQDIFTMSPWQVKLPEPQHIHKTGVIPLTENIKGGNVYAWHSTQSMV